MNRIKQNRYYKQQSLGTNNNRKPTGSTHDEYLNDKLNLIQRFAQTNLKDNQKMNIWETISQTSTRTKQNCQNKSDNFEIVRLIKKTTNGLDLAHKLVEMSELDCPQNCLNKNNMIPKIYTDTAEENELDLQLPQSNVEKFKPKINMSNTKKC